MSSQTRKEAARARRQATKRMLARKRTRQEATRKAGEPTVAELLATIQAAQRLYPSEVADPLIGEPPAVYGVIQRAVEAEQAQFWMFAKSIGARGSGKADRTVAQHTIICLDLVYRAFAAGVDHGRRQALGAGDPGKPGPDQKGGDHAEEGTQETDVQIQSLES